MATPESSEDRAARIVREAVERAISDMEAVVARYLAEGRPISAQMMAQITTELERIAAQYGQQVVVKGKLGELLTETRAQGAKDGGAGPEWIKINADALEVALQNDKVKIKGILDGQVAKVNEIIAGARVSGKSRAEVVREIMERIATEKAITKNRAETIFRAETYSGYRQFQKAAAEEDGVEHFMQRGIIDDRTTNLCLSHIGQIKTADEWEKLEPLVFQYGLHYNCRCSWVPVVDPEAKRIKERAATLRNRAKAELSDRKDEAE